MYGGGGLEEFCNIGKLPDFKRVLNFCRGSGIFCQLIVQSIPQLQDRYPKNGVGGADRLYGYSDLPWMQRCGHGDLHLKKVRHGHYQGGEQPNATFAVVFSGL